LQHENYKDDLMDEVVIDGSGDILGRTASAVAKMLLKGSKVSIVNAEKMLISGHFDSIVSKYKRRVNLKDKANPEHSPFWSRRPDLFVKRVVRGMLPYKQAKGKSAYKNLRVYIGLPKELEGLKPVKIAGKPAEKIYERTYTVEEIAKALGYNK